MLGENTMLCGCVGIQDQTGKWLCPEGHEYVEAWMAGEITKPQMIKRMKVAKQERERLQ